MSLRIEHVDCFFAVQTFAVAFCDSFVPSEIFGLCCVTLLWAPLDSGRKEHAGYLYLSRCTDFERHRKIP